MRTKVIDSSKLRFFFFDIKKNLLVYFHAFETIVSAIGYYGKVYSLQSGKEIKEKNRNKDF